MSPPPPTPEGGVSEVYPTCGANLEVGGFVGNVAHGFDSRAFHCDLGGVSQRLVHVHFERTLGDLLASEQHSHLREGGKEGEREGRVIHLENANGAFEKACRELAL